MPQPAELASNKRPLRKIQAVNKKYAIQMINLMLKDASEEAISPDLHSFKIEVAISYNNSAWAIYLRLHAGDGQASLIVNAILI